MKNALEQIRPQSREVLEILDIIKEEHAVEQMKTVPREKMKDCIIQLWQEKHFDKFPKLEPHHFEEMNRDLWSLYTDKVEDKSEAAIKMKAVNQGEGLWIYIRLHQWFNKTTEQGKNNRRTMIMSPETCKWEHEIVGAIEEWEEKYRILIDEDQNSKLPEEWRMTAIKRMLCGDIKKQIEYRDEDFKSYEDLRSTIMRWAITKKIEKDRKSHDAMDVDGSGHLSHEDIENTTP